MCAKTAKEFSPTGLNPVITLPSEELASFLDIKLLEELRCWEYLCRKYLRNGQ